MIWKNNTRIKHKVYSERSLVFSPLKKNIRTKVGGGRKNLFFCIVTLIKLTPVRSTKTHHLSPPLLGDLHLLEHLVPLLHEQRPLVGVVGDVRVLHLDHLHLGLNPAKKKERERRGT